MTDEQIKMIADSINRLVEAAKQLAENISSDEPFNYSIARRLDSVAEKLNDPKDCQPCQPGCQP